MIALIVIGVAVIVVFDFTNGFHDASNVVATVIASRAMTPTQAVCVVAFLEFLGPLLGGTAVADTTGGFVQLGEFPVQRALIIILCGILGAIAWNILTWRLGVPSSSSHALVGALAGADILGAGPAHVVWGFAELQHGRVTGITKTLGALQEVVHMFRRREVYRHLSNAADRVALAGGHLHDSVVKAI
jgi:PiT family inorganic phosphate transporter